MEEEILTIEEDAIFSGVSSVNGKTGDVSLKTINNQSILGTGNIKIKGGGVTALVEDTTVIFTDDSGVTVNNNTLIIGEEE